MLLGIEQFGNCEKHVVKNRQSADGHLPTSAAAIHPQLRHFGDNDLWFIRRWPILRVSGSVEMHKTFLCNHSGLCHVDWEFKEKRECECTVVQISKWPYVVILNDLQRVQINFPSLKRSSAKGTGRQRVRCALRILCLLFKEHYS